MDEPKPTQRTLESGPHHYRDELGVRDLRISDSAGGVAAARAALQVPPVDRGIAVDPAGGRDRAPGDRRLHILVDRARRIGKVLVAELLAREKPRYTVWASGAGVVTNTVGNLLLVPRIGVVGATIVSSVSYSILSAILIVWYLRVTGLTWTTLVPRRRHLSVIHFTLASGG